jgi:hypothetical protein
LVLFDFFPGCLAFAAGWLTVDHCGRRFGKTSGYIGLWKKFQNKAVLRTIAGLKPPQFFDVS